MRPGRSGWRSYAVRLAFELIVVFVGVYAAFALSELEAGREAAERRRQVERALVREIRDITTNAREGVAWMGGMVAFYDSALAATGTPPLEPVIEPIRVRAHMWESTLASGGLELLDVRTIYRISEFYNELNAGFEQLDQLRALSEAVLIPNLDRGTSEFYAAPGRLRAKYGWYLLGLRRAHRLAERITAMGDTLARELERGAAAAAAETT